MMYSWRQRSDTRVFDEPYYGIYLANTDVEHPDREAVIHALPIRPEHVYQQITAGPDPAIRFVKNMAHHLDVLDMSVLGKFENVLLIRNPRDMVPSLAKTLGNKLDVRQTGLPQQVQIVEYAEKKPPIVIDAKRFLADPETGLRELCRRLELAWEPGMLSWPAGSKPEDGVWAQHWYHNVHRSTGFGAYRVQEEPCDQALIPVIEESMAYYETLLRHAL